ncbi:uroporphyrinogen-III C-methyltransferase [Microbulbifer sp. TYP-18]|uniref:uroporphyrinogen-III C-methyltransferase n=1 Tax=Microbulbifer sp. TYP-18 TaxID=3230024 RepID=UPI0034C5E0B1
MLLAGAGTWSWYNWPQLQAGLERQLASLRGHQEGGETAQPTPASEVKTPAPASVPGANREDPPRTTDAAALEAQRMAMATLTKQLDQQRETIATLQQQLAQLQRTVTAQSNRLGQLGNVSRDDWRLAEAEYLLRLANQRLLLERDSGTALSLLEEADNILRQVDLPDLYGVRRQLTQDITALKLVDQVDLDGIYLRLRALEEQMLRTSIQPEFNLIREAASEPEAEEGSDSGSPLTRSWHNFFTRFLSESIRIRDGNIDPVLLSPQSEVRFRQNLRLNMEQAELALLRGDTTVYRDSLNRARQLLLDYGTASDRRDRLVAELDQLISKNIAAELPSLAASQNALHNYMEGLGRAAPQSEESELQPPDDPKPAGDTPAPEGDSQ